MRPTLLQGDGTGRLVNLHACCCRLSGDGFKKRPIATRPSLLHAGPASGTPHLRRQSFSSGGAPIHALWQLLGFVGST